MLDKLEDFGAICLEHAFEIRVWDLNLVGAEIGCRSDDSDSLPLLLLDLLQGSLLGDFAFSQQMA